jgi:hypothetical protein
MQATLEKDPFAMRATRPKLAPPWRQPKRVEQPQSTAILVQVSID